MNQRTCLTCGDALTGRPDKKFCSDHCRSTHNNQRHATTNPMVRSVNRVLAKNRRILEQLNPQGQTEVSQQKLLHAGFDFRFYTSSKTIRGILSHFCYEHGYRPLKNNKYQLLITDEEL
jgi:predicted nucleic acid-binding Zn ribbon protein